jgi:hypothetical protein
MTPPNNQDRVNTFFRRITGNQGRNRSHSTYESIESGNRALLIAVLLLLIPLGFWLGTAQLQRCQQLYGDEAAVRYRRYQTECYDGDRGIGPL